MSPAHKHDISSVTAHKTSPQLKADLSHEHDSNNTSNSHLGTDDCSVPAKESTSTLRGRLVTLSQLEFEYANQFEFGNPSEAKFDDSPQLELETPSQKEAQKEAQKRPETILEEEEPEETTYDASTQPNSFKLDKTDNDTFQASTPENQASIAPIAQVSDPEATLISSKAKTVYTDGLADDTPSQRQNSDTSFPSTSYDPKDKPATSKAKIVYAGGLDNTIGERQDSEASFPSSSFSKEKSAAPKANLFFADGLNTFGQRQNSDSSFPSSYDSKEEVSTSYFYEEKQVAKDLEQVIKPPAQLYILGLRQRTFYILLGGAIIIIGAIILGAVWGVRSHKKDQANHTPLDPMEKHSSTRFPTPTFTAYPLEIGPYEINEPIDVQEGICLPNPQAIDECNNPYEYKFNVLKDSVGYKLQTDLGILNHKYLYPPKTIDGMYSFNITDWEFPSSGEYANGCNTTVNAYLMLAANYRFHVIFHYTVPRSCQLLNGYIAEAGQYCHCEWKGYVYDNFKSPDQTTATQKIPPAKPTKPSIIAESSTRSSTINKSPRKSSTTAQSSTQFPVNVVTPTQSSTIDASSTEPPSTFIDFPTAHEGPVSATDQTSTVRVASTMVSQVAAGGVLPPVATESSTLSLSFITSSTISLVTTTIPQ